MSDLYDPLKSFLKNRTCEFSRIDDLRKQTLIEFSKTIQNSFSKNDFSKLIFVCTHNSRRSQIAQMLALASADFLELPGIEAYSGGTETTEFYIRSVQALINVGFKIDKETHNAQNPKYAA